MRRCAVLFLFLFVFPTMVHAQALRVRGRVTDQANEPMVGVTVAEKGTFNSTATDNEGRYELQVGGPDAVLLFSAIGFHEEERRAAGEAAVDVSLTHLVSSMGRRSGGHAARRSIAVGHTGRDRRD